MKTITREEYNRLTKGLVVPMGKSSKVVDIEANKKKAIDGWKNFGFKVKVEQTDGSKTDAKLYPYKTLSFKELGNVKVAWTNKEGQQEKEYSAIEWENGRTAVFMGYCYKGVVPVPNNEGLYMFG